MSRIFILILSCVISISYASEKSDPSTLSVKEKLRMFGGGVAKKQSPQSHKQKPDTSKDHEIALEVHEESVAEGIQFKREREAKQRQEKIATARFFIEELKGKGKNESEIFKELEQSFSKDILQEAMGSVTNS